MHFPSNLSRLRSFIQVLCALIRPHVHVNIECVLSCVKLCSHPFSVNCHMLKLGSNGSLSVTGQTEHVQRNMSLVHWRADTQHSHTLTLCGSFRGSNIPEVHVFGREETRFASENSHVNQNCNPEPFFFFIRTCCQPSQRHESLSKNRRLRHI